MTQIAYPYTVDKVGRTAKSDEDRHIRELIDQLLFTSPGERVNRSAFGTGLLQLVFEPNSEILAGAVEATVQASLQQHLGGRVDVERVEVASEDAVLRVEVIYTVRRTGQRQEAQFVREI